MAMQWIGSLRNHRHLCHRALQKTTGEHEYMRSPGPSPQAQKRRNARVFICLAETRKASDYIGSLMVSPSQHVLVLSC